MDAQEFSAQVEDLEKKMERLRALYEMYFSGIEKLEPRILRRDVERGMHALRKERCHNTGVRFRFQMLVQRYTTLMSHWQRICREIEEGTYEPHLQRARKMLEKQQALEAGDAERPVRSRRSMGPELVIDVDLDTLEEVADGVAEEPPAEAERVPAPLPSLPPPGQTVARVRSLDDLRALFAESGDLVGGSAASPSSAAAPAASSPAAGARARGRPSTPPAAPRPSAPPSAGTASTAARPAAASGPARPAAAPAAGTAGLGDDKLHSIREAFSAAARQAPAPVAVPSSAALRKSLEKELRRMTEKHPGKQVDFRVDLKDGKPVIKSFVKD